MWTVNKTAFISGFVLLAFVASIIFWSSEAHAIRVSMKRIVFGNAKRSEILTIINNTAQTQTYRLGWRKYRMGEKRALKAIEEGEPSDDILWADNMIRFAPRRATIPAGSSQQIRLLFRRPADLQEAEYRSHLWIVTENRPELFKKDKEEATGHSVRLAVQPALSLPVFVRNGDLTATASIKDTTVSKAGSTLNVSFTLGREGTRSLYGDLDFVCSVGGKELVLQQVRGISVYMEVNQRFLSYEIPLETPEEQGCNNVTVFYRADPDDPQFKGATLAEGTASF